MKVFGVLATLVATISAAAIPALNTRATCPAAGASFLLQVSNGGDFTGRYAHAGAPDSLPFVIFGVKPNKDGSAPARATEFKLNSAGNLISIQSGKTFYAYEQGPGVNSGHVAITTSANVANKLVCSITSGSCALKCTVAGYTYNYLASPKYQPDWRIAGAAAGTKAGNIAFSPVAIPA